MHHLSNARRRFQEISDFSSAEQGGFLLALEEYYNERSEDGNPISSMSI